MLLEYEGRTTQAHSNANICTGQSRKTQRPYQPRPSLQPGKVLILLAGRFRGKRVVLLKHLPQGVLLVTGPFKVNGVPLRRVNARYVIATKTSVDISGIDNSVVEKVGGEKYFAREKKDSTKGEEGFFKQGEKPEVQLPSISQAAQRTDNSAEEGSEQGPRGRPEVGRQGHPSQHQEGAFPVELPELDLLAPEWRQATRDGLLSDPFPVAGDEGRDKAGFGAVASRVLNSPPCC